MALIDFQTPEAGIALLVLNRPEARNAVTPAMTDEMRAALRRIEADDSLHVTVLTGAGKVFCAGMDLAAFAAGARPGLLDPDRFAGFANASRTKPVIAAVNGAAVAGGFELVLACDIALAAGGAVFGLPEVKRGLIAAGGGAIRLPRRIPPAIANEMLLTGDPIDADQALSLGLITRVLPPAALLPEALALARRIAANAPVAVRGTLALSRQAAGGGEEALWSATEEQWRLIDGSVDALEGAVSFKEKRPPVWTGR